MIKHPGFFITLEGIDGAGKTVALSTIENVLKNGSLPFILTREPGGTPIAEKIRQVLFSPHTDDVMLPDTELLLMFASRVQHINRVIRPALQEGKIVVSDRFTDASFAYQGGGRSIPDSRITILEKWVQQGLQPDLTFLLDVPVDIAMQRSNGRDGNNYLDEESIAFFERVRAAYLKRAQNYPKRYRVIDASKAIEIVQKNIRDELKTSLNKFGVMTSKVL